MSTRASGAPFRALATAATCSGFPTPASTSAGSRPGNSQVLLPEGPVHSDGLPAGMRIGVIQESEKVLQAHVGEVAVGEAADRIQARTGEPAERALQRHVIAKRRRH